MIIFVKRHELLDTNIEKIGQYISFLQKTFGATSDACQRLHQVGKFQIDIDTDTHSNVYELCMVSRTHH